MRILLGRFYAEVEQLCGYMCLMGNLEMWVDTIASKMKILIIKVHSFSYTYFACMLNCHSNVPNLIGQGIRHANFQILATLNSW